MESERYATVNDIHATKDHETNALNQSVSMNEASSEFGENNVHSIFYQGDLVRHKNTGAIGIVSKVACDSDAEYGHVQRDEDEEEGVHSHDNRSADEDEGGDNYKKYIIQKGKILVKWIDCTEPIQEINKVTLLDRPLLAGYFVASLDSSPSGEIGIVRDINVVVDLLAADGSIMKHISTSDLKKVKHFTFHDFVLLGSWFGLIKSVRDNVTVLFDNGSQKFFEKVDPKYLLPVSKNEFEDDVYFPYYPGQRVTVDPMLSFDESESSWWEPSWWREGQREATVIRVEVGSVLIKWSSVSSNGSNSLAPPDKEQSPENIKLLEIPKLDPDDWELGQRCLLPQSSSTINDDPDQGFEKALLILSSTTTVDVEWQNGVVECGRDSKTLIRPKLHCDQELFHAEYVLENAIDDGAGYARRDGFVKSVNVKEKTASVRWLNPVSTEEEIVSLYELESHPDYAYWYGSIVYRLPLVATTHKPEQQNSPNGAKLDMDVENLSADESSLPDFSWVGMITGVSNGYLEVAWGDNTVSMVGPHEICEFEDLDSDDDESIDNESEDGDSGPFRRFFSSAIELFTKAATVCTWNWKKNDESDNITGFLVEEGTLAGERAAEDQEEDYDSSPLKTDEIASSFKCFDTAKDPLDHHFCCKNGQVTRSQKWLKKLRRDWSILQNSLPDGIYVRMYEDRMDLLRAVIVGAYGTPYQDGIFFFDFYLPPEYPDVPPVAYYNSGGWKINQNLYEDGRVCLSLLNTWEGEGTEIWNPTFSSILQVLVSIQALVLNEKPYFNEAGYDTKVGIAEEEKHSLSYNENVFLLNCKTMMYLIRKPPKDFDEFVQVHFKKRGYYILKACDAYLNGRAIGSLDKDACASEDVYAANSTSVGFRIGLKRIASKLYSTLLEMGADCSDFAHLSNT